MARGLQQLADDAKRILQNALGSVSNAASNLVNKPGPAGVSLKQAAQRTSQNFVKNLGDTISGKTNLTGGAPLVPVQKIPVFSNLAKMAANSVQAVGSGMKDIGRAAYKLPQAKGALDVVKNVAGGVYGAGKILSTGTPVFQGANIATQSRNNLAERLGAGIMRGQTGEELLADNVQAKNSKIKVMGHDIEFDPAETVGKMVGFVKNPINEKIFGATEGLNLIPKATSTAAKAANFLLTNFARGGTENLLMALKDIPENATVKEKANFLRDNILTGAASELLFRGGMQGANKLIKSTVGKLSDTKLSQVLEYVKQAILPKGEAPISAAGAYKRDTVGRFSGTPLEEMVAKIARDAKADITQLPDKLRKAVNDYRFENDIKLDKPLPNFLQDPKAPNHFVRDASQMYGAAAGIAPEYDEKGKLKGVGYNPVLGVAGLAATNPTLRKGISELKPKTDLLNQADELLKEAQPELEANKAAAEVAKTMRDQFSPGTLDMVDRAQKLLKKSYEQPEIDSGAYDALKQADPKLHDTITEQIRMENNPNLSDEEAIDVALGIPSRKDTQVTVPQGVKDAKELRRQANSVYDLVYNSETDPRVAESVIKRHEPMLAEAAKDDFREWEKSLFKQAEAITPAQHTRQNLESVADAIRTNTGPSYINDTAIANGEIKDIGSLSKGWRDIYRNFKESFGKFYPEVKAQVLDPFDAAKGQFVENLNSHADEMERVIVNDLGIKKGSDESAAVQKYGEGLINAEGLVGQFGKEKAQKIIEADNWFRHQYDSILDDVNATRAQIYPENPEKIIPKRNNYYRHFKEMSTGLEGLKNIFETPAGISSGLSGTSEYVQPKSKWLSFAQRRLGGGTAEDAVGGFIDYVKSAEYAKNIDPQIDRFRQLKNDLVFATDNTFPNGENNPNAGKLNNLIEFLDDFSGDLAGKTNPIDRTLTKIGLPRKALKVMDWINSRVKANMILGNASSAVAQIFNVPQGLAEAGPIYSAKGIQSSLMDAFAGDNALTKKSTFLNERFEADPFSKFDTSILDNVKKFAAWMTGALDEVGTKTIWHANYQKALGEGIQNPMKYADDITREMVAGRGIGEVPLAQKSKLVQMLMPFQLEVANTWHVMKGWADQKAVDKAIYFTVLSFVMNRAAEQVRGSDVSFDPLNALIDGIKEYDDSTDKKIGALKGAGRVAGEVLSNIPGGQSIAAIYPEAGLKIGNQQLKRADLFGEGDPTRFGSDPVAIKGLQDPAFLLAPPFGGVQLKRTLQGTQAVLDKSAKDKSGNLQYALNQDIPTTLQTMVFGKYASPNARFYFDNELANLTEKQTQIWDQAVKQGQDPVKAWTTLYQTKLMETLPNKISQIAKDRSMSPEQRRAELGNLTEQYKELNANLQQIGKMDPQKLIPQSSSRPAIQMNGLKPGTVQPGKPTLKVSAGGGKGKKATMSKPKKLSVKKISLKPRSIKLTRSKPATVQSFM